MPETVEVEREELLEVLFKLLSNSSPWVNLDPYMSGMEFLLSIDCETGLQALGFLYGDESGAQQVEFVARILEIDLAEIPNPGLCAGGCGQNVGAIGEHAYMVLDEVWQAASSPEGVWCIGCLEDRLGRELTPGDFNHTAPLTTRDGFRRSERLRARLGRTP